MTRQWQTTKSIHNTDKLEQYYTLKIFTLKHLSNKLRASMGGCKEFLPFSTATMKEFSIQPKECYCFATNCLKVCQLHMKGSTDRCELPVRQKPRPSIWTSKRVTWDMEISLSMWWISVLSSLSSFPIILLSSVYVSKYTRAYKGARRFVEKSGQFGVCTCINYSAKERAEHTMMLYLKAYYATILSLCRKNGCTYARLCPLHTFS